MRTPLKTIRISCDVCEQTKIELQEEEGISAEQVSAVLSASGWATSRGRDICPACVPSFLPQARRS